MIAQIAISSAVFAMDKPYDYLVPPQMQTQLQPGMRVMVPFGRANRRQEGMVLALDMTEKLGLKSIEQMLDKTPVLSEAFLRLAAFLRERYFCTFYDASCRLDSGLPQSRPICWQIRFHHPGRKWSPASRWQAR